jgi:TonB family protein
MDIRGAFRRKGTSIILYAAICASALLHTGVLFLFPSVPAAPSASNTNYRVIRLADLQEQAAQTEESPEPENIREIRMAPDSGPVPARTAPRVRAEQAPSSGGTGGFYSQFSIDELPRIAREAPKIYPAQARDNGKEGRVVLDICIDAEGRIADVRIIHDPGSGLAQAALEYVRGCVWEPAKVQGRPVPVRIRKPVVFRLNE